MTEPVPECPECGDALYDEGGEAVCKNQDCMKSWPPGYFDTDE